MKLILGLGVTGLSVARFFNKNNISFRIADSRQEPPMLKISKNENLLHDFYFGEWNVSLLDDISEIIISPGIAESELIVRWARKKNISIISDIELFGRYVKAPMIGITGSNGKSTCDPIARRNGACKFIKSLYLWQYWKSSHGEYG
jgi:UDP-N-acetylmuramoylalanine--D-glutamate ligase